MSHDGEAQVRLDEPGTVQPSTRRLRPQYARRLKALWALGFLVWAAYFMALMILANLWLGRSLPGFRRLIHELILGFLSLPLLLASGILGLLTVHAIAMRILVHRGVLPYLSVREVITERDFPEHWYTDELLLLKPRLKPCYAAVVGCLGLVVVLLALGIGGLASVAAATAVQLDWNARPDQTPHAVAIFVLMLASFLGTMVLFCFAALWLIGSSLVRRGLLPRGDLTGFMMGTRYPPKWCTTEPLPRRRPVPLPESLRFSVRRLLGVVAVIAVGLALAVSVTRGERQSVRAIQDRGGTVWYDWRYSPNNRLVGVADPWWQRWGDQIGVGSPLGAALVVAPQATDDDLPHVGRLRGLSALDLSGSTVTDAGLARLNSPVNVQSLFLDGTPIKGTGLAHLAGARRLRSLSLARSHASDLGMVQLIHFTELTYLDLGNTPVGDLGLGHLSAHKLDILDLRGTKVSDEGMAQLGHLESLTWLNLSGTNITDRGLLRLKRLTNLQTLGLKQTAVTAEGAAELQKALPGVRIVR